MIFIFDNMFGPANDSNAAYANSSINPNSTEGGHIPVAQDSIRSVYTSLVINSFLGVACMFGFLVLRTFMKQYQLRLHVPSITVRPPVFDSQGVFLKYFGWLHPVFTLSDAFLLRSSGLDALVLQKSLALGVQIFLPMAIWGCSLLLPLQLHEGFIQGDSSYGRLTMSNVRSGSAIMWAHWATCFLFLGWTLLLLEFHTRQYAAVRQHYLKGGDAANYWRDLHMAEADGTLVHKGAKILDVMGMASTQDLIEQEEELLEIKVQQKTRWQKAMNYLTSWTGHEGVEGAAKHSKSLNTHIDLAHDIIQGDFARDAALKAAAAGPADVPATTSTSTDAAGPGGASSNGLRPRGIAGDDVVLTVPDSQTMTAAAAAKVDTAQHSSLNRLASLKGGDSAGSATSGLGGTSGSEVDQAQWNVEGVDIGSQVAHKWWVNVTHVSQQGGKSRKLKDEEIKHEDVAKIMLAKPSVRFRKTVNAYDHFGRRVAVNAQQYAVLVVNVNQPCYPEYMWGKQHIPGAGKCGNLAPDSMPPAVKYELKGLLDGHAEEQQDKSGAPGPPEEARPKSTDVEAGSSKRRGDELWALVRNYHCTGRLKTLGCSKDYSLVANIFSTLFPHDFDRVVPVFNYRRVDLLIRVWDVRQGQLEAARFRLAQAGKRPTRKTKCCGGEQVDAISWLEADIARLEQLILKERDEALKYAMTPSWFALFRSQKAAAIAASCNILPINQDLFQVHPAPGPEEVNWEALWFNSRQRAWRAWMVTPFTVLVVLLPVSLLTSAISQLNSTFCEAVKFEWYCRSDSTISRIAKGLVTGFLPSLLIILWQGMCLPRLVYMLAQSEGRHYSLSAVDRRMGEIYFYWDVFNMFAQGVLGATAVAGVSQGAVIIQQASDLINKPQQVPNLIGQALPASSKFFFTYLIMRTFMAVPLRFLITQPGVWQSWLRLLDLFSGPVPPRVEFMRHAIRSPRYGVEFGNMLLIMLISMGFSIISPLMLIFAAAFFAGMWIFWRYQLIYNYQRKYEAGGLIWHFYVNRILVCLAIMVVFTGCVMIVKLAFVQATTLWVAGSIFIIAFARRLNRRYMNAIVEMPLYLANAAPVTRVPSTAYVPPPLQANGMGWYPEFNKVWEWFGMPGYSY